MEEFPLLWGISLIVQYTFHVATRTYVTHAKESRRHRYIPLPRYLIFQKYVLSNEFFRRIPDEESGWTSSEIPDDVSEKTEEKGGKQLCQPSVDEVDQCRLKTLDATEFDPIIWLEKGSKCRLQVLAFFRRGARPQVGRHNPSSGDGHLRSLRLLYRPSLCLRGNTDEYQYYFPRGGKWDRVVAKQAGRGGGGAD